MHWYLLFLVVFIGLLAAPLRNAQYEKALDSEAHEILKNGLQPDEQLESLRIILARDSDFCPPDFRGTAEGYWRKFAVVVAIALLVCVMLSIAPPPVVIGIGKQRGRLRQWRKWSSFACVTIPTLVVMSFFWPLLVERITAVFTH